MRQRRRHQLRRHHHDRGHRRRRRLRRRFEPDEAQVYLDDVCQEAKDAGVEAPDGFTVRLVTDIGKIDDRTFNQYAYEGMTAADGVLRLRDRATSRPRPRPTTPRTSPRPSRTTPTCIITAGFLLYTDTLAAAEANPDVELHRHRPVPARVPGQLHRHALQRGRGRLHGRRDGRLAERERHHRRGRRPRGRPAGRQAGQRLRGRRQVRQPRHPAC